VRKFVTKLLIKCWWKWLKKKDPEEEEIAYLKKDIDLELQAKKEVQWNNDELERRSDNYTVKCLVEYPFDLSALLPLYDLVWRFDKESVCLCMNSSCLPGQTVKLISITPTKPTSRLNKSTRLSKTFQQFGFSTLSRQTNRQVDWILD